MDKIREAIEDVQEREFEAHRENGKEPTNHLFVIENSTSWVVWHIIDVSDENVNSHNYMYLTEYRDGSHFWPQANHFWTFEAAMHFCNETVLDWDMLGEETELTFI